MGLPPLSVTPPPGIAGGAAGGVGAVGGVVAGGCGEPATGGVHPAILEMPVMMKRPCLGVLWSGHCRYWLP
jgi:hypothetical protein